MMSQSISSGSARWPHSPDPFGGPTISRRVASIEAGAGLVHACGRGDPFELALAARVYLEFGEYAEHVDEVGAGKSVNRNLEQLIGRSSQTAPNSRLGLRADRPSATRPSVAR